MPKIVDREQIKLDIMKAFQECARTKILPLVTLRDVAKQAGMSHTKVLSYFNNKENLMIETSKWVSELLCNQISEWFNSHNPKDYPSKEAYLDALFSVMVDEKENGVLPKAMVMNCISGDYNEELNLEIQRANIAVRDAFWNGIKMHYGEDISVDVADSMLIVFGGMLLASINGMLSDVAKNSAITRMKQIMDYQV